MNLNQRSKVLIKLQSLEICNSLPFKQLLRNSKFNREELKYLKKLYSSNYAEHSFWLKIGIRDRNLHFVIGTLVKSLEPDRIKYSEKLEVLTLLKKVAKEGHLQGLCMMSTYLLEKTESICISQKSFTRKLIHREFVRQKTYNDSYLYTRENNVIRVKLVEMWISKLRKNKL